MTNFWSKYLLPVAVAGLVLAETVGTEALYRTDSSDALRAINIAALQVDTTARDSTAADKPSRDKEKKSRKDKKKDKKQDKPAPPPRPKPKPDVFIWDDDTMFYGPGSSAPVDTLPAITARDTMVVPDSLRTVNPFLYKWYVATKDSLIHRVVVDSLRAAGDSTDWIVIDSIYKADSAAVAKALFDRWYASLSKAERKRYDYEQMLPKLLREQDSILQRKDSLKAIRDSIRENTPRVLDSGFIPDSMQYKRLITWRHDRAFNRVELFDLDTTFRYHFYDYPFLREDVNASWLGVSGSPVQTYNYFKRNKVESVSFFEPYESWTYTPETLPMYNTKTPYTELEYYGTLLAPSSKESDNLRLFTTQNILPQLNYALEYKLHSGAGILQNEETKNKTTVISVNWLGKKYLAHGGMIRNRIVRQENGGIQSLEGIIDPKTYFREQSEQDVRLLSVRLSSSAAAGNKAMKKTYFFDQSYRIPFTFIKKWGLKKEIEADSAYRDSVTYAWRDSVMTVWHKHHPKDSTVVLDTAIAVLGRRHPVDSSAIVKMETRLLDRAAAREEYVASLDSLEDVTTVFIGSSSEYSIYSKVYTDKLSASDATGSALFQNNFFVNPSKSVDSLRYARLDNRVYLRIQPWSEDFIVSRIEGGIGDRWLSHYMMDPDSYLMRPTNVNWNTVYTYAGVEGKLTKAISWNAIGQYNLLGDERNDFSLMAGTQMDFHPFRRYKKSPVVVKASFETSLKRPEYFQQEFRSNHYRWSADFSKISTTKVQGSIQVPRWRLGASAGYALLANNIYYDSLGVALQNDKPMSVLMATLDKDFVLGGLIHMDHRLLFQYSSNQDVLPLPLLAANLRYYLQFNIVREDVMKMQIGADLRFNTGWNAPSYNPVTGTFTMSPVERYTRTWEEPDPADPTQVVTKQEPVVLKYHNGPVFDLFVNVQWKRACIFVKWENAGLGWPATQRDYFTANRYIGTDRQVKLGIYWPFYTMSGKQTTLSSKAGSSMGGGKGGGGLGGMLGGGGLGGMLGGGKSGGF